MDNEMEKKKEKLWNCITTYKALVFLKEDKLILLLTVHHTYECAFFITREVI